MVRNHRWYPQGKGWTCIRCFEYTTQPDVIRKGCGNSPNIGRVLGDLAEQVELVNKELDRLERKLVPFRKP